MSKLSYHRVSAVLIIIFSLGALSYHVLQLHSFFVSALEIHFDNKFFFEKFAVNKNNDSSTILFLGDVMLGRNVEFLSQINGVDYSTARIAGQLPKADAVIANFESAMALPHVRTRAYTTQFSTAIFMLPVLTELGVTHASLANNHTLDFGRQGYENAVRELKQIGVMPFGHSTAVGTSSVTIIDGSVRIGIIGINTIFVNPNNKQLREQIDSLKQKTDIQVAYVHWGDEYISTHNTAQADLAQRLVSMGIDVIIGHHPHVVQDIDVIDGALVFYSLGNFIFDQYFSTDVQEGFALHMTATTGGDLTFSILPITSIDVRSQPRSMTKQETTTFLSDLAGRSNDSLKDAILNNNLRSYVSLASAE